MKTSTVYIMTNINNTTFYTGVCSDLVKRGWEHKNRLGSEFTKKYKLSKLVYYEIHNDITEAIKREKQIKNLVRRKKVDLVNNSNADWKDLYPNLLG